MWWEAKEMKKDTILGAVCVLGVLMIILAGKTSAVDIGRDMDNGTKIGCGVQESSDSAYTDAKEKDSRNATGDGVEIKDPKSQSIVGWMSLKAIHTAITTIRHGILYQQLLPNIIFYYGAERI